MPGSIFSTAVHWIYKKEQKPIYSDNTAEFFFRVMMTKEMTVRESIWNHEE